ncbi:MAG: hypothetical protein N3A02_02630, partial [Rectinema sp.]|nr:hypothetical protein [Rectinema sp.]
RLMGGIAQNTIPIADYYKKEDENAKNPFRAESLHDLVNVISATWIGEPYRLPPKKVRFVALSDLDDGRGTTRSQSSSSVTFESTYPRPWFGYYKDKKWYAWGGKYRIHARTQDAVICFLPNGGAIMPEFLRNKRYYAKIENKSGKQYPKPITGTLPNEEIRSFVQPAGQDRPPWECTWDVPEIVHFLQHTGGYHITLGPDVRSRDPGAYEDAEDVLTSLLPAYRIYISRNGGIGMFAVKRGDTPENAKKWSDIQGDCPLGWWSQNNATIKVYRSPVGKPILAVVNKDMLEKKIWWVDDQQ